MIHNFRKNSELEQANKPNPQREKYLEKLWIDFDQFVLKILDRPRRLLYAICKGVSTVIFHKFKIYMQYLRTHQNCCAMRIFSNL
jgi:hypothetical protein